MDKIAILDYGSQYTHLIARRIRGLNVYSEILDTETPADMLKGYKGIILSGGPNSVYESNAPKVDPAIFDLGLPILGICYGHQLMTLMLGGTVEKGNHLGAEYGRAEIEIKSTEGLLKSFENNEKTTVWMSHGDKVTELANGFEILASSADDQYSVIGDLKRNFYGVQFHPEVVHSSKGNDMYANFIDICKVARDWDTKSFIEHIIEEIKKQVDDRKVFMLVSGGVDSSVAYSLLVKALGNERVKGYMVDTGMMRKDEAAEVKAMMARANINIEVEEAQEKFLKALEGLSEPEDKRKVIGSMFLDVQAEISEREKLNPDEWLLGQGTIYPDTIESGATKHSHTIKTHHNRIERIQKLMEEGLVIEPIKELYKDEVRAVGLELGLPKELIQRRPFPGPGLGVRILCSSIAEETAKFSDLNQKINDFLQDKFKSKFKALVLPVQSVGVQGDSRTYKHPLCLFGAAENFEELKVLSPALTNKFSEINRVIYLAAGQLNEEQIHGIQAYMTQDRIDVLQDIDSVSRTWLDRVDISRQVWQMPVVLLPLSSDGSKKESIVLRPVVSEEAMTANFAELDMTEIQNLGQQIIASGKISAVFYDITNKPPGTIEWE